MFQLEVFAIVYGSQNSLVWMVMKTRMFLELPKKAYYYILYSVGSNLADQKSPGTRSLNWSAFELQRFEMSRFYW